MIHTIAGRRYCKPIDVDINGKESGFGAWGKVDALGRMQADDSTKVAASYQIDNSAKVHVPWYRILHIAHTTIPAYSFVATIPYYSYSSIAVAVDMPWVCPQFPPAKSPLPQIHFGLRG